MMQLLKAMFLKFVMCLLVWNSKGQLSRPEEEFTIPSSAFGSGARRLYSLAVTKDRKAIVSDIEQSELMLVSLQTQSKIGQTYVLKYPPWSLALLSDGLIAVTIANKRIINFVNVSATDLQRVSRVRTARKYWGITGGPNDTLIVGAEKDPNTLASARIDVISRDGEVIRTIFDGTNRTEIEKPYYLKFFNDSVYVSDFGQGRVHRLKIDSGELETTFNGIDPSNFGKYFPCEIDFDQVGNMYVAVYSGRICGYVLWGYFGCVILITRDGQVKILVRDITAVKKPVGLSVTPTGIIVSWISNETTGFSTELTAYSLQSSESLPMGTFYGPPQYSAHQHHTHSKSRYQSLSLSLALCSIAVHRRCG